MADRFPLVINTTTNRITEIPSGDNLDLDSARIVNCPGLDITDLNVTGVATIANITITSTTLADLTITGLSTVGDSSDDTIIFNAQIKSDLIPDTDDTYNIGAATSEWKDIYIDGLAELDDVNVSSAATIAVVDINSGNIDGTVIGSASSTTSFFTTSSITDVIVGGGMTIGAATTYVGTNFVVNGTARILGVTTFGSGSITIDGDNNTITGVTQGTFTNIENVDLNVSGASTVAGLAKFNGNVDLGNATSDTITATGRFDSDIVPSTDSARDLGTTSLRWAEVWSDQVVADNIQIAVTGTNEIDTASGNLTIDSAGGTTTIDDNASVSGTLGVTGATTLSSTLGVTGATTLSSTLGVTGASTFTGAIDANGGATIDNVRIGVAGNNEIDTSTGNLTIDSAGGTTTIDDALTVTGNATFNGTIDVDGQAIFDDITVSAASTFTGLLDANGGATIDNVRIGVAGDNEIDTSTGNLTIDSAGGTTTLDDNVSVSGTLGVTGTTTLTGALVANGNVDLGNATSDTITATGQFDSDLVPSTDSARDLGSTLRRWAEVWSDQVVADNIQIAVTGTNEIDTSSGNLTIDSAGGTTTIDDILSVSGNATFSGTIDVDGQAIFDDITVSAASTFTGLLDANGGATIDNVRIGVAGDNEIDTSSGNLTIDSAGGTTTLDDAVSVSGTLGVTGATTLSSTLGVTGTTTLTGALVANGNVDLGNATSDTITATGRFDSDVVPSTDSARDLGTTSLRWAEIWSDQVVADNIRIAAAGTNEIDTASGNLTIDSAGGTTTLDDNVSVSGTLGVTGATTLSSTLAVTGATSLNGNTTIGDATTDTVAVNAEITTSLIPDTDDASDLGSSTKQWRNLFIDGTAEVDTLAINGTTVTSTAAELNVLDGITATTAELNHTDGVTSNIQTQLNSKAATATTITAGTGLSGGGTLAANRTINLDINEIGTGTPAGGDFLVLYDISGSTHIKATVTDVALKGQKGQKGEPGVDGQKGQKGEPGPVGGSTGQILYNADGSSAGGDANMTYDTSANQIYLDNAFYSNDVNLGESLTTKSTSNAFVVGPYEVSTSITLTVTTGCTFQVV